jgi:pimeloyl-ACP methyl ester carboxylesterase
MHTSFITFGSSRVSYSRWGNGPQLLLCFHGYGESAAGFSFLGDALGDAFTVFAIDLPFHGATDWQNGLSFNIDDLVSLLHVMTAGQPPSASWWLMGYSMGGRIALSLMEKMPEKIQRLILVAPDGLRLNFWYWLATQTGPGRRLFRWTIHHPGWFLATLRAGHALRLVNLSIYKFVVSYIGDAQVRQDLYSRWICLRSFRPHIDAVKTHIRRQQLPVRLLYGRYDRVIRVETGQRFCTAITPFCKLEVLDVGHRLLQTRHLETLLSLLKE